MSPSGGHEMSPLGGQGVEMSPSGGQTLPSSMPVPRPKVMVSTQTGGQNRGQPQRQPINTLKDVPVHLVHQLQSCPPTYHTNWIKGDGNCLFAAFAKALGRGTHSEMRSTAVHWIGDNQVDFIDFVPGGHDQALKKYLEKMSQQGVWGDYLTLGALCEAYKVHVHVLKRGHKGDFTWMEVGDKDKCKTEFWLYLNNHHYENLLGWWTQTAIGQSGWWTSSQGKLERREHYQLVDMFNSKRAHFFEKGTFLGKVPKCPFFKYSSFSFQPSAPWVIPLEPS
ncbi:OTU-like cysteine protease-domain-containing protein [Naematelia encephala]|uniref:OTU-like cysteine protease-domain-containing protein n=1 Tax=Naematelia encephala TaxID=71784 RepID=A0A1Y2B645_9TREE|nr:OTU-like cysteine protease-domain-containing protein [Naematelia encephala]